MLNIARLLIYAFVVLASFYRVADYQQQRADLLRDFPKCVNAVCPA